MLSLFNFSVNYYLIVFLCLNIFVSSTFCLAGSFPDELSSWVERVSTTEFQREYLLDYKADGAQLSGRIASSINRPFSHIKSLFHDIRNLCLILPLNINVRSCIYRKVDDKWLFEIVAGPRQYESDSAVYSFSYLLTRAQFSDDLIYLHLQANKGPISTANYHIELTFKPMAEKTLVGLGFSHEKSSLSRVVTGLYLAFSGAGKVGFSTVNQSDGQFSPVRGEQGIVERNLMRYLLAIRAFIEEGGAREDLKATFRRWFFLSTLYREQLYEIPEQDYMRYKLNRYDQQRLLQQYVDSVGGKYD